MEKRRSKQALEDMDNLRQKEVLSGSLSVHIITPSQLFHLDLLNNMMNGGKKYVLLVC